MTLGAPSSPASAVPVVVGVEKDDAREFAGTRAGRTAQRREVQTGGPPIPKRQKYTALLQRRDQGRDRRRQRRNHGERRPGSDPAVVVGGENFPGLLTPARSGRHWRTHPARPVPARRAAQRTLPSMPSRLVNWPPPKAARLSTVLSCCRSVEDGTADAFDRGRGAQPQCRPGVDHVSFRVTVVSLPTGVSATSASARPVPRRFDAIDIALQSTSRRRRRCG